MSKQDPSQLSRRAFLRGVGGVTVALPTSMFVTWRGQVVFAQNEADHANKLVTFYFPNGCAPNFWNFDVALSPLAAKRQQFVPLVGLKNSVSEEYGRDGHEQGGATLFVGKPLKDENFSTGASIDQIAAATLGRGTMLRNSLVMGVWRGFAGGSYRSPSWFRRSWQEGGVPVQPLVQPLDVIKLLFGATMDSGQEVPQRMRASVLDLVKEDYQFLASDRSQLSKASRAILTDHLDRIRDIEKRTEGFDRERVAECRGRAPQASRIAVDSQGLLTYAAFDQAFRLQIDLLVLALSCGLTATGSLMFGSAGEEYLNPAISPQIPDHVSSHYESGPDPAAYREIYLAYRRHHMSNLLYLVESLERQGMLDSTIVVAGSEFGESNTHTRSPQPHVVAGGGKSLRLGQVLDLTGKEVRPNDLYRTLLKAVGIDVPFFGLEEHNTGLISALLNP